MSWQVLAILRQIFFAIIVDTFGKLREEKFDRLIFLLEFMIVLYIVNSLNVERWKPTTPA